MVARISLSRGYFALVDDADADLVGQYRWWYRAGVRSSTGYAYTTLVVGGRRTSVRMHRFLLDAPQGMEVDHENGDGLDNRRGNLRLVTRSQNEQAKRKARKDSGTATRGVYLVSGRGLDKPYRAYVYLDGRRTHLGYYATLEEAATAASRGRQELFTHAPDCVEMAG